MAKASFKVTATNDAEFMEKLNAVPQLERHRVGDQVTRAGAKPVVKRARALAPRSQETGTSRKRSQRQQEQADFAFPLWKTIKSVVRKYGSGAFAVIGPAWPKGNKAYFNTSPGGRRQVLWGLRTGKTIAAIRNWIVQGFDETRPQQLAAMKAKLTELMDDIWRR